MAKVKTRNNIDYSQLDYEDPNDMDVIERQSLDDILALSEPWRTNALKVWVEGFEQVNIKATKTPFKGGFWDGRRWREFTIPPKGRNFDREHAVYILQRYGENGRYRGKHQETALTNAYLQGTSKSDREYWAERGITLDSIPDTYVYHDNKQAESAEAEPEATVA